MLSWSSGHSVQAFGTGSESLTSDSYHWPQLEGHRGPVWNVPSLWGAGEGAQGVGAACSPHGTQVPARHSLGEG